MKTSIIIVLMILVMSIDEVIACIGELYALHINGLTHDDRVIFNELKNPNPNRLRAIDMWNNAILI